MEEPFARREVVETVLNADESALSIKSSFPKLPDRHWIFPCSSVGRASGC